MKRHSHCSAAVMYRLLQDLKVEGLRDPPRECGSLSFTCFGHMLRAAMLICRVHAMQVILMGGAEAYRAAGEGPGLEGLDSLYPGAPLSLCQSCPSMPPPQGIACKALKPVLVLVCLVTAHAASTRTT